LANRHSNPAYQTLIERYSTVSKGLIGFVGAISSLVSLTSAQATVAPPTADQLSKPRSFGELL
jgi:hypothetical protein